MSKIVVAFDGSETALRALRYAMKIADEIHLVNAQPKIDAPALSLHMTRPDIDNMQFEQGRAVLAEACKVLDEGGVRYHTHLEIGEPASTIAQVAKSQSADMIVMGTRGMGAFGNLIFGSTVTKVVHLADVPVTLIK